jgi:hypothetical protein
MNYYTIVFFCLSRSLFGLVFGVRCDRGAMAGKFMAGFGLALRETGQALDRMGCRLSGSYAFKETRKHHRVA